MLRLWVSGCLTIAFICTLSVLRPLQASTASRTLVLIAHSDTDRAYTHNLEFFIRHGMTYQESQDKEYIVIIQKTEQDFKKGKGFLQKLPKTARYVFHENTCFDWGTFGWALNELDIQIEAYTYFIFMNSSIRGPFIPAYFPASKHWSDIFTSRLTDRVKLVGSTISCEGLPPDYIGTGTAQQNPHVQSYIMATDQDGLQVLMDSRRVFECHADLRHAIYHAELGSARAIFQAGYTIDSLMLRYQGVNWRDTSNWNCNNALNPYADQYYDGTSLSPTEVVFIKFKDSLLDADWPSMQAASAYSRWMDAQGLPGAITSNKMSIDSLSPRLGRMMTMTLRGQDCFDFQYFLKENQHFPAGYTPDQLWADFVQRGQFRGDKFRFTCHSPLKDENLVQKIMQHIPALREKTVAAG